MKQILDFNKQEQEAISLERSVGNLFTDLLAAKGRLAEFDALSKIYYPRINGEAIRVDSNGDLNPKGFLAKVSQVLKMVVKPDQKIDFKPIVAGG